VNVRTVKYRFAWCSLRKVAVGQSLPSRSLNPLRNALPGSLQVHFWLPGRILIPLLVTTSFLANNVATELIIPGSSPIRMLARSLVTSYLSMVWPKTGALPRLIPAHDRRRWNQDWQSVRKEFVALQP
jgi:hypothetical protein